MAPFLKIPWRNQGQIQNENLFLEITMFLQFRMRVHVYFFNHITITVHTTIFMLKQNKNKP